MVDASVLVLTNDGRAVVGTLRGYDQATNLALEDCHERVFSRGQGVERVPLGLYFVRGDNVLSFPFFPVVFRLFFFDGWKGACLFSIPAICAHLFRFPSTPKTQQKKNRAVVGAVDEAADAAVDWASVRAPPLPPITH
jgi:small nuclear ribonucleoprotein (snRNP)-like protein